MRSSYRPGAARWVTLAAAGVLLPLSSPGFASPSATPDAVCSQALPERTALVGVVGDSGWLPARVAALGATLAGRFASISTYEVVFSSPAEARVGVAALLRDTRVRHAEVERTFTVTESPRDPLYSKQWALAKVGAARAWNQEVGSTSPVTVAVIDTGADYGHPDLAGKLLPGFNATNPSASAQDDHMHGTHVAGIIAAATNNGLGVAGMSWGADVLPVKALGANGSGSSCDIVSALLYAARQAVRVINMSLGGPGPCPAALQEAVDVANRAGALVVAAAGNAGADFNTTESPANCDRTLGVGATDENDQPATFSNYGSYVDISAPGVNILSTVIDPKTGKHGYAALSGTSMATPMVAGLAALVFARHSDWSPEQVSERLRNSSRDLGPRGWDPHFGAGRIDAARALS